MKDTVTGVLALMRIGQHTLTHHCERPTAALGWRGKGRKSNGWSLVRSRTREEGLPSRSQGSMVPRDVAPKEKERAGKKHLDLVPLSSSAPLGLWLAEAIRQGSSGVVG